MAFYLVVSNPVTREKGGGHAGVYRETTNGVRRFRLSGSPTGGQREVVPLPDGTPKALL